MSDVPAGLSDLVSNHFGFRPKAETCCERCVFGSGIHAEWCPVLKEWCEAFRRVIQTELPKAGESVKISKPRRRRFQ